MKCRRVKTDENNIKHIVWFGSYGKNDDGTAKFVDNNYEDTYGDENNGKHNNFSSDNDAVKDSLIQRLNIIRGELWYNINKGLPIFDKVKQKGFIDSYVISTITEHTDVININYFSSKVINNHYYTFTVKITTKYGVIDIKN